MFLREWDIKVAIWDHRCLSAELHKLTRGVRVKYVPSSSSHLFWLLFLWASSVTIMHLACLRKPAEEASGFEIAAHADYLSRRLHWDGRRSLTCVCISVLELGWFAARRSCLFPSAPVWEAHSEEQHLSSWLKIYIYIENIFIIITATTTTEYSINIINIK